MFVFLKSVVPNLFLSEPPDKKKKKNFFPRKYFRGPPSH